jgi:deazaflavin-dependent oxidoreductase (nitroreductase family)
VGFSERARARYPGGRPNEEALGLQRRFMRVVERGLAPFSVVLETRGRTSGQPRRVPLVMVRRRGIRYLVSMLGPDVGWVRNAHAAGGHAAIVRRHREEVVLTEVPVGERAPILRRYLLVAFGARPHMKVRWNSPLRELEQVAAEYPVFRVDRATP